MGWIKLILRILKDPSILLWLLVIAVVVIISIFLYGVIKTLYEGLQDKWKEKVRKKNKSTQEDLRLLMVSNLKESNTYQQKVDSEINLLQQYVRKPATRQQRMKENEELVVIVITNEARELLQRINWATKEEWQSEIEKIDLQLEKKEISEDEHTNKWNYIYKNEIITLEDFESFYLASINRFSQNMDESMKNLNL